MAEADRAATWQAIVPSGEFYHLQRDRLHHSPAVRAGQLLICSGVVGAEASGKLVPEPGAQIERAFENLARLLVDCGASLGEVAELLTFHVDFDRHIGRFAEAKDKRFASAPYPAWTAIGVASLAFGAVVEIRAVAAPAAWQKGGPR